MNEKLQVLPINSITIGQENLRAVRETDLAFIEIRESIKAKGVLMPIVVSPKKDANGDDYYLLVDGAHRYTACSQLGLEEIPCSIIETKDGREGVVQVLELQIAANSQKADTKPAEYAEALKHLIAADPLMTNADLADQVNKSTQWVDKMLSLNNIKNEDIRSKIDNGEINVMNAYQLARLDDEDQAEFLAQAMTESATDFQNVVTERIKDNKEKAKAGRDKGERTFPGKAIRRKDSEISEILADDTHMGSIVADAGVSSAEEAFALGLKYTLSLDPSTLDARRTEWEENESMRKDKAEKAKLLKKAQRIEQKKMEFDAAAEASAEAVAALSDDEIAEAKRRAKEALAKKKAKQAEAKAEDEVAEDIAEG